MKYDDFIKIFKTWDKIKDKDIEYEIERQNQPESMADEDVSNESLLEWIWHIYLWENLRNTYLKLVGIL